MTSNPETPSLEILSLIYPLQEQSLSSIGEKASLLVAWRLDLWVGVGVRVGGTNSLRNRLSFISSSPPFSELTDAPSA